MKYLLLIWHNPGSRELWETMSEAEQAEGLSVYAALNEELAASGELVATEALADRSLAKRVTVCDETPLATDGPFAEVKEELAGFYLVDCESEERAVAIAGRIPEAAEGLGHVEIRPVLTHSGLEM
jgi:hypothetical protein